MSFAQAGRQAGRQAGKNPILFRLAGGSLALALILLLPASALAQARAVPGEGGPKIGLRGPATDTGGIAAGLSGFAPAPPGGCGGAGRCNGMGGAGAGIGEASCGGTQTIHALSPTEGLNLPSAIYQRAPDFGGAPGLTSLGFLGRIFAGAGTVHEASGELRFSIPLFKISGLAPGFLADFSLFYRSYPGDPDAVRTEDNGVDKKPFGPGFRPFWGDKLEVPPQKTKAFVAPAKVTRVDYLGQVFTYDYDTQQGSTYLYKASGRGDRLVCQNGTWYRELPDRTYVEYADVYGTGELYIKRIFWVPTSDPVAVPDYTGSPLVVEYVYE
ncbi:MAG TPA: hypothetical protein ENJ97_00960, partial [Planctomycetes bacterium]|nr:hypothetical protein [Planctomycetota bacterium]